MKPEIPANDEYPEFISDEWEPDTDKYHLLNLKNGRIDKDSFVSQQENMTQFAGIALKHFENTLDAFKCNLETNNKQ